MTTPHDSAALEKTRLERLAAIASAEKIGLRETFFSIRTEGGKIRDELSAVEAALRNAEHKVKLLTAPRAEYVSTRADTLARGLLGEPVALEALVNTEDFAATLTATDLAEGVRALKRRRDDLASKMSHLKSQSRTLTASFYQQHAIENGAKYMIMRNELAGLYTQVLAANKLNATLDAMKPILTEHVGNLLLPAIDDSEHLACLRPYKNVGSRDISGTSLALGLETRDVSANINNELQERP